jgi:hypothetical protein
LRLTAQAVSFRRRCKARLQPPANPNDPLFAPSQRPKCTVSGGIEMVRNGL